MKARYDESVGDGTIDIENPPKFSEEQLQYLQAVFAGNLRIYAMTDLLTQDKLFEQFLVWNGHQMVLDHIKDLIRIDADKESELLK